MPLTNNSLREKSQFTQPKFLIAQIVYILCLVMEYLAITNMLDGGLLTALVLHLSASLLMPWPLCYFMPKHFRVNFSIFLLLFLLCFFIPVLSGICLLLSLTVALYFTKPPEQDVFEYTEPLRAAVEINQSKPDYGTGRIFGILRFAKDEDKRIKAVLSTNQLADEVAIPILRIALLDSVDEVRLMAYSILDNKEKKIDSIIHEGLNTLKTKNLLKEEARKIHYKLAEAYWELSYLGLVKGSAREHTLLSAKHHANEALFLKSNEVGLLLLLVQVLTCLGYFKEASILLKKIKKQGISSEKLASRNAELAFERKQFYEVSRHVKKLEKLAENNIILDGMVKQWT